MSSMNAPAADSVATIRQFLELLYGEQPPGYLTVNVPVPATGHKSTMRTEWFNGDCLGAASRIAELAESADVYIGMGRRAQRLPSGRGKGCDVCSIGCLWIEIDYAHSVHKKASLPPDRDAALAIAAELPIRPTYIIHSGHGFYFGYCLKERWDFEDNDDRQYAQELLDRLTATLKRVAGARGHKVDNISDLAWILRPPGTFNRKDASDVLPVVLEQCDPEIRYDPSELAEVLDELPQVKVTPAASPANAGEVPADDQRVIDKILEDVACEMLWRGDTTGYASQSEADLALMGRIGFFVGWEPARMEQVFSRSELAKRDKWERPDYRRRTVERARGSKTECYRWDGYGNGNGSGGAGPATAETGGDDLVLDPKDPLAIAKRFRATFYQHADGPTLWNNGTDFEAWNGRQYEPRDEAAIRSELYPYLWKARKRRGKGLEPFQPMQSHVNNVIDALKSDAYCDRESPCWLSDVPGQPDPTQILAATNGLVHLRPDATAKLWCQPTPRFFSRNAIDFPYDPAATEPVEWIRFLDQLFPEDRQSIELLQEWFGYVLTPDTRQEKILLIIGPKRAGKGTIARVLRRLVGAANVCGPTLSGMATNFGLWAFIGKLLAIIDDARLSSRADQAVVVERLLTISGEGAITIDRKSLKPVDVRLPTRIMMLTNELPRLNDPSGALASRFLVLNLTESFFDREDTGLEDRLCAELPGILLWAIRGWCRLRSRGKFQQPATSKETIDELGDLASPIGAFVREWCGVEPRVEVKFSDLFGAWGLWCREQGREHVGTQAVFGRDLRSAVAGITTHQRTDDDSKERYRTIGGIRLKAAAQQTLATERARQASRQRHSAASPSSLATG